MVRKTILFVEVHFGCTVAFMNNCLNKLFERSTYPYLTYSHDPMVVDRALVNKNIIRFHPGFQYIWPTATRRFLQVLGQTESMIIMNIQYPNCLNGGRDKIIEPASQSGNKPAEHIHVLTLDHIRCTHRRFYIT